MEQTRKMLILGGNKIPDFAFSHTVPQTEVTKLLNTAFYPNLSYLLHWTMRPRIFFLQWLQKFLFNLIWISANYGRWNHNDPDSSNYCPKVPFIWAFSTLIIYCVLVPCITIIMCLFSFCKKPDTQTYHTI